MASLLGHRDLFLREGYCFETPIHSKEDLVLILAAAEIIQRTQCLMRCVYENMFQKYTLRNEQQTRQVEAFL